jgi:hypothetical protein
MAKKKSGFNLGKILYLIAAVLGVVAIVMMFVDTVKIPDVDLGALGTVEGEGYSGMKVAFGYKEDDVAVFGFSFMALLPWILVIAGVVLTALNTFSKKGSKLFDFISIAAFIVAGVLFFIMPNFMVFAETLAGAVWEAFEWKLAVGAIVAAVCSIVAGGAVLVKNLMK